MHNSKILAEGFTLYKYPRVKKYYQYRCMGKAEHWGQIIWSWTLILKLIYILRVLGYMISNIILRLDLLIVYSKAHIQQLTAIFQVTSLPVFVRNFLETQIVS
jgi:hypothetical protein